MTDNALLNDDFPIAFDRVAPDAVGASIDALLQQAQVQIDALCSLSEPPSFENLMLPLEALTHQLSRAMAVVGHLESVSTTEALRDAYNEAQPRVSAFISKIPLSAPLWKVVQRYADSAEAKGLKGPRARYVQKTVAYFKRHGAELEARAKERLAEIDIELTTLTLRYSQNVLDATQAFSLLIEDDEQLAGLPESARAAARQSARDKGQQGWRFTLQAPSYAALMTHLDDATIRERSYRAMSTRATEGEHDNRSIAAQVLALRTEKASLLGYTSFADLVLEDRMAKTGTAARAFIDDLEQRTREHFEREIDQLLAFRRAAEGPEAPALAPWDVPYYAEKQRRARYSFDDEALRPYFGFERVLEGLLAITSRVFGVRFERWQDAPCWQGDIRAYKVVDEASGRWLAGIYVDAFPRETKQSGAWMHGVLTRGQRENDTRHIGIIVANLTPPIGDADAQLTHRDVETLFHEFGHLMHHCLSDTELRSQAGTQVAWDFVELPSQLLENWCWEREALDLFARHVDDDSTIPEPLLDAMRRARTYRAANHQMRQLGLATADLSLHVDYDPERDGEPTAYMRSIMNRFSPAMLPDDHAAVAAFDHLFGSPVGYAAGYYSYKWAEVLDADAFTRFAEHGLFDQTTGRALRDRVLARGDEQDPAALYVDFMGREPRLDPLLERLGLGDGPR